MSQSFAREVRRSICGGTRFRGWCKPCTATHVSYGCARPQAHPPTGITHCAEAFFTNAAKKDGSRLPNLIVVRATRLEVYGLR